MSSHNNPDYAGSSFFNLVQSSLADAHRPMYTMFSSPSVSIPSLPSQFNPGNSISYAAAHHAQPAASHPPSHTRVVSQGFSSAGVCHDSSIALPTATTNLPAPNCIRNDTGISQSQTTWQSTILQNKQIVEAWQARLLAQLSFPDQGSSSSSDEDPPTTHASISLNSDETNHRSNTSSSGNDPDSNSSTDSGPRSSKGKLKRTALSPSDATTASPSDGTAGSSFGSRGSGGSGGEVCPDSLDATSSSSHSRHKKKKDKKKSKGKKGKEQKQKQVDLYPRKKKSEQQRSNYHMVLTLDHLTTLFHLPLKRAADELGICTTALKSVCRKFGLERWPFCRGNKDDDRGLDLVPP